MIKYSKMLIAGAVLCSLATSAFGQFMPNYPMPPYNPQYATPVYPEPPSYQRSYPHPNYTRDYYGNAPVQQEDNSDERLSIKQHDTRQGMPLSRKCAMASEYIKANNCGPQGCDVGLCTALKNGCHIQWWGHHPDCSKQRTQ